MIEIKNLSKQFGADLVLRDVSLSVAKGEVVAVIGPSGSGKSTLLRCINLLEVPTSGSVRVGPHVFRGGAGKQESVVRAVRSHIGMVFQNFHLFPHLSILENITYGPTKVLKISQKEAQERAMRLLDRVGLQDRASSFPRQLSGGQKQRVAIARTLAMEPDIVLFDEPTSSLDPEMVKEVLDFMKELAAEHMTMVVVTHEMRFAQAAARRLLFMDKGELVENTTPAAFFKKPKTERAQVFLSRLV